MSTEVDLQELLQKTAESIIKLINFEDRNYRLKMTCKWGFYDSSGYSQYKQKKSSLENTNEFLFLIAMTPLRLFDKRIGNVLWINQKPVVRTNR